MAALVVFILLQQARRLVEMEAEFQRHARRVSTFGGTLNRVRDLGQRAFKCGTLFFHHFLHHIGGSATWHIFIYKYNSVRLFQRFYNLMFQIKR